MIKINVKLKLLANEHTIVNCMKIGQHLKLNSKIIDSVAECRGKQNLENVPFRPGLRSGWHIFAFRAFQNVRLKWLIFVDN